MKKIQNLRVDYSGEILKVDDMESNPINEFKKWFYFAQKNVKKMNPML